MTAVTSGRSGDGMGCLDGARRPERPDDRAVDLDDALRQQALVQLPHRRPARGPAAAAQHALERGSDRLRTLVGAQRSEEHTSELQSRLHLVCRLLLEKKKNTVQVDILSQARMRFAVGCSSRVRVALLQPESHIVL